MTTGPEGALRALVEAAERVLADLRPADDDRMRAIAVRLRDSVVEPLQRRTGRRAGEDDPDDRDRTDQPPSGTPGGASGGEPAGPVADRLWELACVATGVWCQHGDVVELAEAAAALQDIALGLAEESALPSRAAELAALQSQLVPRIQTVPNGPYVLSSPQSVVDHLGAPLATRPVMALCRCGQSGVKPTCDGNCHRVGFTDGKDPDRVLDRRDTYVGQSVTVLDNRGTCQHSGYCTDRLATVFHLGQEPFVTPSGGRMDEIIRAVRDCPSGALSYALDDVEARAQVDYAGRRQPTVVVSKDGPYRITGGLPLVDGDGADVPRNQGASREHYALCRCGHSQNKPFCSGVHWYVNFTDPPPDPDRTPTMFEWAGGLGGLERMTRLFYEKYVPADPLLAPLFADMSADHPQRVAKWLGEVFGGPTCYSDEYGGYPRMLSQHIGKCLTEEQRARWVTLLTQSAAEAGLPNDAEFRSAFGSYIEWGSRLAVENSQTTAHPPEQMPMPHWDWSTAAGPPGSRMPALATADAEEEPPAVLPAADEPVRFEKHIKPLFRARDRQSMRFAFDLWSYEDVRTHADAILDQVRNGTMPCDGAWPAERVETFQRWISSGSSA
jgi:CDGSH-type Zn-finger protein/truncated hemoglobin YjbI